MECRELTSRVLDRTLGEADDGALEELSSHLAGCPACREEALRIERTWGTLGEDPDAPFTADFERRSLELLEDEMMRRRIREFKPRRRFLPALSRAAALLLAGVGGYFLAKGGLTAQKTAAPDRAVASPLAALDLGNKPRFSNVSYRPQDASGRIGIAFDVSARQDVVGKPEDPAMASLLAYLVSQNAETAGEKSRAIELVSTHYGTSQAAASPEIVRALTSTLRRDTNPGVRKKAADALAGFRMTPEIRGAFLEALRNDRNPAVRLVAVERLAAAAKEAPDAQTIESLREKASDPGENGFVRAKAASALKAIDL